MNRRRFVTAVAGGSAILAGCFSSSRGDTNQQQDTAQPNTDAPPTTTAPPDRTGIVENHRITAVEATAHDAVRHADGSWTVEVTLRVTPQGTETTAYPIGVFVSFLNGGATVYETYQTVPANTGEASRMVTLSSRFDPGEASAETFDRYRIELVHG